MSRVTRVQHRYDQELADSGQCRVYRNEYVMAGDQLAPVLREVIVPVDEVSWDRTPWWKRDQKKVKSKKKA